MKTNQVYVTCDYVQHTTRDKAISHLLNKAHLELTQLLKDCDIDGAYRIAQIVINSAYDDKLTNVYDRLHNTLVYLQDTEFVDND